MRLSRETELLALVDDMAKIKERDPGVDEIVTELGTVCETIKSQAVDVSRRLYRAKY